MFDERRFHRPAPGKQVERQAFDRDYVERLTSGDPTIQSHFSKYFGELLTIKLRSRVRSSASIDDLRQETLLRVFQCLRHGGLQQPERLGAFVNTVCNNVLFEYYREGRRECQLPGDGFDLPSNSPGPESTTATEQDKQQIRKVLQRLPKKDRDLLRSVFVAEQDKDEICREYGVDRGYLRVLLHRAMGRLKQEHAKAIQVATRTFMLLMLI